ncbi:integrase arm-type DNA-binding domain-containing protein [Roseovarius sp. PS-C2]|uniref:tyrosine-type recombinase/integrase n=1 Tax=Roseovarius sp. PS-C2 TaxID=2820814 RepID=UPI001C0B33F5|nr:site-specific integrase [Roseovarius sp. PS-C2]MBU3261726.1 integrase arm-type DNA-binding domain-containing protein [Roseovarius sp. PS-C2]
MANVDKSSKRHPEKALSAVFVRQVVEPGKYSDGNGLFLLVQPNGSKSWVQRITIRGKRRDIGLGGAGYVSLAEARELALENKKLARAGGDPLQAKHEAQAVLTFAEAARKVHEIRKPTWRNKKHAAQFITTLESYAFPKIGPVRVGDITTADVLAVLQPIWLEKPETARRVRQRVGVVMKWAIAQGWRQDNPAENIGQALPKHETTKNHRKALPYAEVSECIGAVQASNAWPATKLALEFLILTAARSGEVRGALWEEIEFHGGDAATSATSATWEIPASRMKAKKAHRVPLSGRALEILKEAEALRGASGLVFPSARDKPLSDMTLSKLVKEQGFDVHVHGFRTSFKTWAQEQTNFPNEVSEAALAHVVKDKAEAAYARSDMFEKRRKMMKSWAGHLEARGGEVVALASKRET